MFAFAADSAFPYGSLIATSRLGTTKLTLNHTLRDRIDLQEAACKNNPPVKGTQLRNLDHIIIDIYHNAIYCAVPGTGSSKWEFLFAYLYGVYDMKTSSASEPMDVDMSNLKGIKGLSDLSPAEVRERISNYWKFVFVINPFERLYTIYLEYFNTTSRNALYFQNRYGVSIIRKFRDKPQKESLLTGNDVTFHEFIQYVIYLWENKGEYHSSWRPISELCLPCTLKYDFIGHVSTFTQDSQVVLRGIYRTDPENVPGFSYPPRRVTKAIAGSAYRTISKVDIAKLQEIYRSDFITFGFAFDSVFSF